MNKMWGWTADAIYLVKAGRATINIQMPPGMTLKHITYNKCEKTGQVVLNGQLTAFNFVPPVYSKDGSSSTEAVSGYEGVGADGGAVQHCGPTGGINGGTLR